MLTVRNAQLKAFEAPNLARFIDGLVAELQSELPGRSAKLGPEGVRAWAEHGVSRAATYSIVGAEAVGRYVRLMFVFGRDFDVHPDLPGVHALLTDPAQHQDARIDALTRLLSDYVAKLVADLPPR